MKSEKIAACLACFFLLARGLCFGWDGVGLREAPSDDVDSAVFPVVVLVWAISCFFQGSTYIFVFVLVFFWGWGLQAYVMVRRILSILGFGGQIPNPKNPKTSFCFHERSFSRYFCFSLFSLLQLDWRREEKKMLATCMHRLAYRTKGVCGSIFIN